MELVPPSYVDRLDLRAIFARHAPVEVDLGCGDGSLLIALAARHPERNFLGIERLAGRVRSACRKAARLGLTNVRVLRLETSYAVSYLLPHASVDVFYLLFPDPWPKKRHHRRRIVTVDFLQALHAALATDGVLCVATDQLDYFEAIRARAAESQLFCEAAEPARRDLPLTTFERHFRAARRPIYRLELRKILSPR